MSLRFGLQAAFQTLRKFFYSDFLLISTKLISVYNVKYSRKGSGHD